MRARKIPRRSLAVAVAALTALPAAVVASPAGAASNPPPVGFVSMPTSLVPGDHGKRMITVTYRNNAATERTVAPQILVESPERGPFLDPSDFRLEMLAPDGHWHTTPLSSQTGTLYTLLTPAKVVLPGHHTLTEQYRLTVLGTPRGTVDRGTIEPRVALYN
jgi:hypothetical protein